MRWLLILFLFSCSKKELSEIKVSKKIFHSIISQGGDVIQKINSFQSPTGKVYLQKVNSLYIIWVPLDSERAQVYTSEKELSATDNQWESVTSWGLQNYYEVKLPDSKTGTWSGGGITAASVAQTAGATLTVTFTGTGLKFMSYKDSGAGQYTWSINSGQYTGSINLYSASAGYGLTTVVEDLPYGTYTIVMTIVNGSGLCYASLQNTLISGFDASIYLKCFYVIGSPTPNSCYDSYGASVYNPKNPLRGGHQFFAFSTKASSDVGSNEWIPNHSTIEYASKFADLATDRLLRINDTGDNKITSLTDNAYFAQEGTSIVLRQNFIGVHKDFPNTDLFDITQVITWNQNGLDINMRCEALTEIDNSVLYITMHDQSSYEVTGKNRYTLIGGLEKDNSVHGGTTTVLNWAALQSWNGVIIGVDKTGSAEDLSVVHATLIRNVSSVFDFNGARTDKGVNANNVLANTAKYYPFVSNNGGTIPAGTVYSWNAKITMGYVTDAYNVLKYYAQIN